jgi:hypothetical protein
MVRRGKAESYHKDAWKKDTLLLTCILRLRVQPAVSYRDISDILLKALSKHLSGVAENSANLAKLKSTTTSNNTSANTMSTISTSADSIVVNNEKDEREAQMKEWLVQYFEEDFMGAEFRGDQAWWKARDMDAGVIGEMLRAADLYGKGHVVASREEMQKQILWRRTEDWRAGSVPDGPELNVRGDVGTIGDR